MTNLVGRSHLGRAVSHALAVAYDVDLLVPQPEAVAALLVAGEESKREHCYVELDGAPAVIAGATGFLLGRLNPFPKGDWTLHTGDSVHRGQLTEPTGRQGRQLSLGQVGPRGGRLASPTRPLPFGEATSPSATRPRDLRPPGPTRPRATTACAATSSAVPSYLAHGLDRH